MDNQEFTQKAKDLLSSMDKASKLLNRYLDAVNEGRTGRSKYFKKRYEYVENHIESAFTELVKDADTGLVKYADNTRLTSYCANDVIATEKVFDAYDKSTKEAAHV